MYVFFFIDAKGAFRAAKGKPYLSFTEFSGVTRLFERENDDCTNRFVEYRAQKIK